MKRNFLSLFPFDDVSCLYERCCNSSSSGGEDSQKPIYLNGKIDMAFVRKGEGDQKVDNDLLQAMLRNASSSVDSGMQKLYSINDIDPISLAAFKSIVSSRYEEKKLCGSL